MIRALLLRPVSFRNHFLLDVKFVGNVINRTTDKPPSCQADKTEWKLWWKLNDNILKRFICKVGLHQNNEEESQTKSRVFSLLEDQHEKRNNNNKIIGTSEAVRQWHCLKKNCSKDLKYLLFLKIFLRRRFFSI